MWSLRPYIAPLTFQTLRNHISTGRHGQIVSPFHSDVVASENVMVSVFVSNRNLPERRSGSFFDSIYICSYNQCYNRDNCTQWHSTQCTALWAVWNPSPHPALRTQPLQPPVASTGLQEHVGPDAWLRQWAMWWPLSLRIRTHGHVHSAQTVVQRGLISRTH